VADSRRMTESEKQGILALYQTTVDGQWPTIDWVAKRSGRSPSTVGHLVRQAGVSHARKGRVTEAEVDRILELHRARNGPRRTNIAEISRMVKRNPHTVARVIANHKTGTVSPTKTTKKKTHKPSGSQARRNPIPGATAPPSAGSRTDQAGPEALITKPPNPATTPECVGTCSYACTKLCAISAQVSNRAQLPGSPSPSIGPRREPGIPYVRTGLKLPPPGEHSRFSP